MKYSLTLQRMTQILDLTKLKGFAEDLINVGQIFAIVYDTIENIVGKGENPGYQRFLLFQ